MRIKSSILLVGLMLLGAASSLQAQVKKKSYSEEITVTAPYEPSVADGNKISFPPKTADTAIRFQQQIYQIKPFPLQTEVSIKPLDAARLSGENPKTLYRNYLKGGLGTTSSPYAEFFASSAANPNHLVTFHLKHLSSSGSMKDQWFPGFSQNLAEVAGKLFTDQNILSLSAAYSRDVHHYYAPIIFKGDQLHEPTEDSIRQRYGLVSATFELKNRNDQQDALTYSLKINAAHLADLYKTNETNLLINGMIQKNTDWMTFAEHQYLGLKVNLDHNILTNSVKSRSATLLDLMPSFRFLFDEYTVSLGMKADFDMDTVSHLTLYPVIDGSVQLVRDRLSASAGIGGGVTRYNFNALRQINPYISSLTQSLASNERFTIYAALKGNIAQLVDLEARFDSKIIDRMPLFVNEQRPGAYQRRFDVITDDINLLKVQLSARYNGDGFHINAQGSWNKYSTNAEQYAWNCPELEGQVEMGFAIDKAWSVNTTVYAWGDTWAKTWTMLVPGAKKIKGATDLNVGINYSPVQKFTVFVNLNNILNRNYERWNLYPSFGFNAMAGVSFAF